MNRLFYIEHLDTSNSDCLSVIDSFTVDDPKGKGLEIYLKEYACDDELNREMRTYLVRDTVTHECVGYFSLKAGLVSINEDVVLVTDPDDNSSEKVKEFDTLPGVELANFAVNSAYIARNPDKKGVGRIIFADFILPLIDEASEFIGIQILYIFALPYDSLINRYMQYGFRFLSDSQEQALHRRLKPRYDQNCKFMYIILN